MFQRIKAGVADHCQGANYCHNDPIYCHLLLSLLQVGGEGKDQNSAVKKEMKAARKFALVIGLFALCWIPLEMMNAISLWTGKTCLPCVYIAVWLSHLNSALNPLLYAYGSTAVRKAMLRTLCCRGSNQVADFADSSINTISAQVQ